MLKYPNSPMVFWVKFLISKIWDEGYNVWLSSDLLVVRWQGGASGIFAQPEVTILHLGGGPSSCRRTQKYCYLYPLGGNQEPSPRLHYCFLMAPFLSLPLLPSLIRNSLDLPFEKNERLRRLNEANFLPIRKWRHGKAFVSRRVPVELQYFKIKWQDKSFCWTMCQFKFDDSQ